MGRVATSGWRSATAALARRIAPQRVRIAPAVSFAGSELVHLGGGESFPCPDAPRLPMDPACRRLGLGSPSLALPPARVHSLRDALANPQTGVVSKDGTVLAESLPPDPSADVRSLVGDRRAPQIDVEGTVAVYRFGGRSRFHRLVEELPRAALLAHPAMLRFGPVTLLHDGPLDPLEAWLLPRLVGRNVSIRSVDPGTVVAADRVLVPAAVHRNGAGAVPSWYRRWADRTTDSLHGKGPRRLVLASPDEFGDSPAHERMFDDLGLPVVDPFDLSPEDLVATCRDAEVIVGSSPASLVHAIFSRRARVVELLSGPTLQPASYYLAVSKGLPYDYLEPPIDGDRLAPLIGR